MKKSGRFVPARLQTALALLERLRDHRSLDIADHKSASSSGIISHGTYGNSAHDRVGIQRTNKKHERRLCDIGGWGGQLLNVLRDDGFRDDSAEKQLRRVDAFQASIAAVLRTILDANPIEARVKGKSAEAVVREILEQAEEKGKSGDVAQYLVGAKLMIRLKKDIDVVPSNKGDRKSRIDVEARTVDYEIADATIEIAMGRPDEKHLAQVKDALEDSKLQVWLLTKHNRVDAWRTELENLIEVKDMKRVVVTSVEAFVGQNMTEMGEFSARGIASQLAALVELYNTRWVDSVGTPGMRIVIRS